MGRYKQPKVSSHQVTRLARMRLTQEQIAEACGCSVDYLTAHHQADLDKGRKAQASEVRDLAVKLANIMCPLEEIAAVTGWSVATLERKFANDIKQGRQNGKASLRRVQWKLAQEGNPTMCIWLGKQLLGQRDKSEVRIEDVDAAIERELARVAAGSKGTVSGETPSDT